MASRPKIAIIGAGPAGLTLARLLHVSKVKVDLTIFELDASPASRPDQGGTLDLHTDTGLAAIRKCGLWDSFSRYARYEGQEFIFADKNATKLVHMQSVAGPKDRPEIDRRRLKEILLESLPDDYVKWGRKLKEVTEEGNLRFYDGEQQEGPYDLIVGADGAWSKVRARLSAVKPVYSGVSGYEMDIQEPAKTCPHVDKMVGQGMYFGSSDRKMLNAQRLGDHSIKVRSWFMCPEGEAKAKLDSDGPKATLEKILERYKGWAPEMTEFFRQGDLDRLKVWPVYELPSCGWEHARGYTLLGDASSLSSPFGAEGVNKAMKDSVDLAELIEKSQESSNDLTLDQAVVQYERQMFPRGEKLQSTASTNKQTMFGTSAPIGLMTGQLKTMASKSPSMFIKLLGTPPVIGMVFSYFWIRQQIGWAVRTLWRKT